MVVTGCALVGVGVCKRELMPFSNFAVRYAHMGGKELVMSQYCKQDYKMVAKILYTVLGDLAYAHEMGEPVDAHDCLVDVATEFGIVFAADSDEFSVGMFADATGLVGIGS